MNVTFYRFARTMFRAVGSVMFRLSVTGADRVPAEGAAVVVAAHRSWLDPACVGGAIERPVRFLIMESVYRKPWARWFYRLMGAIPVTPGGRDAVVALRAAIRALESGQVVGVFPEGRVYPEGPLGPVYHGAALLASRARVPVFPVRIRGSARAWPHGSKLPRPARVEVVIGSPIPPVAGRDEAGKLSEQIAQALSG